MTSEVKDTGIEAVPEKLNSAQKLAKSLGLPYKASNFPTPRPKKYNHKTFRSSVELKVKKREHAKRVGRPK